MTGVCKECRCTTGGGDYCYRHAPFTVLPLADGTYRVDRVGQRTRVTLDPPPTNFTTNLEQLAIDYHKNVEGEYGCPGLSCSGVQRLVCLLQKAVNAQFSDVLRSRDLWRRLTWINAAVALVFFAFLLIGSWNR